MDDLVKRLRLGACALEIEQAADRIEELQAKLAKAVAFMNHVADGQSKDYTNNCDLARTTLAELKGQGDE